MEEIKNVKQDPNPTTDTSYYGLGPLICRQVAGGWRCVDSRTRTHTLLPVTLEQLLLLGFAKAPVQDVSAALDIPVRALDTAFANGDVSLKSVEDVVAEAEKSSPAPGTLLFPNLEHAKPATPTPKDDGPPKKAVDSGPGDEQAALDDANKKDKFAGPPDKFDASMWSPKDDAFGGGGSRPW